MGILIPGEFVIIRPSTRARSRVKRYAEVAELVDAHDSGSCARKGVEVRVFSSAPPTNVGGKWQVPKKLNSTNQQISCYDKEKSIPPSDKLLKIVKLCKVDPGWLLSGRGNPY